MESNKLTPALSVCGQITAADVDELAKAGFRSIICNRPDGEEAGQPDYTEIETAARAAGLSAAFVPVMAGGATQADAEAFAQALAKLPQPVMAYCRTGNRSGKLWIMSRKAIAHEHEAGSAQGADILIVGGGAAGIALASSLLARKPDLDITVIEPSDTHYYQPGWTLVGAGVFSAASTARPEWALLPSSVKRITARVVGFEPAEDRVLLEDGRKISYRRLAVVPGLKLNWAGVEGLEESLGKNGVTSNYRYDLAPYTWQLVQGLKGGKAVFTQPPMPIKCAGAPQKALYLSADHWTRQGVINNIKIDFFNAGAVLFGVKDYVPALMAYIEKYGVQLNFNHTLTHIDGARKTARFARTLADGSKETVEAEFDMIHVVPPQQAPDFIRSSPLADAAGWVDVDQATLRHKTYANIWSLGDVMNAPNAKTAAAARKQAPIVAHNMLHDMGHETGVAQYNGYGSCPLTVEKGKIVFAEFGYGGKLLPTFPLWLIDGQKPSRLAWLLKERVLPPVYWHAMLKGREWLAAPEKV